MIPLALKADGYDAWMIKFLSNRVFFVHVHEIKIILPTRLPISANKVLRAVQKAM